MRQRNENWRATQRWDAGLWSSSAATCRRFPFFFVMGTGCAERREEKGERRAGSENPVDRDPVLCARAAAAQRGEKRKVRGEQKRKREAVRRGARPLREDGYLREDGHQREHGCDAPIQSELLEPPGIRYIGAVTVPK